MTNLPNLSADPPKEPALATGTATGTIGGVISLALVLIPDLLTDRQITIILVIAAFALPIISGIFTRPRVFSPATVKNMIDNGLRNANDILNKQATSNPRPKSPDDSDFFKN